MHFHRQVPIDEIPPILAASDALLVPLSAHPTFEQFVPSKMIDFMASGRPVVLSARRRVGEDPRASGGGVVVEPEIAGRARRRVRWLAEHRDEAAAMGRRGRDFAAADCARFRPSGSSSSCSTSPAETTDARDDGE